MSVRDLAVSVMLIGDAGAYPVERDGRIIGSITPSDVAAVRPELRRTTPLFEAIVSEVPPPSVDAGGFLRGL